MCRLFMNIRITWTNKISLKNDCMPIELYKVAR